jgi:transcriptional regulator with XRE-family HTH domain
MRQVGDKIGAPAATVSQLEKGQRALKEPKIALWAAALEVSEVDLRELWVLSQGQIPVGDRLVFYSDRPDVLGAQPLGDDIVATLRERPDLEPIYRLAERIAAVLRRLLPDAGLRITPDNHREPPFVVEPGEGSLTAAQEDENKEWAETFPLPCIERCRGALPPRERGFEFEEGERIRVPLLRKPTPIVRRRGKSVSAADLEDLLRELSGPERERVRGYIDAIVEHRADPEG